MNHSEELGTKPISQLIRQQATPAAIGILVLSIYGIVDTIFVGRWIGSLAIGAITVVLPITFLIASIGMAIGVGGASIISRALGGDDEEKAMLAFGNQVSMTLFLALVFVVIGSFFQDEILRLFGGQGNILPYAQDYFQVILYGIPFLAFAMMSNNVIRAEGAPKIAMMIMVVPAVVNVILDPILIVGLGWGMKGAAWATSLSYMASASFGFWYFIKGDSELRIKLPNLALRWAIVKEIFQIGGVTFARQGSISLLAIVLNNSLFAYGGELSVSVYGIINRVMMFANFPVLGITQGFLPIAGYNFGAKKWERVKETIYKSVGYGTALALGVFAVIMLAAKPIASVFTIDQNLISQTGPALMIVFLATPLLAMQLLGSAYYQAIGKPLPALLLTLLKQGIFLIPLILILPRFFGITGIWFAFPIADMLTALVNFIFLKSAVEQLNPQISSSSKILDN